jgi:hypothetical protein
MMRSSSTTCTIVIQSLSAFHAGRLGLGRPPTWPAFLTAADSTSAFFSTSVRVPVIDTGTTVA